MAPTRVKLYVTLLILSVALIGGITWGIGERNAGDQITPTTDSIRVAVFVNDTASANLQGYQAAFMVEPRFRITYFCASNITAFQLPTPASAIQEYDVIFILDLVGPFLTVSQANNITYAVKNGTIGLFFQTNSPVQIYDPTILNAIAPALPLVPVLTAGNFPEELQRNVSTSINTFVMSVSNPLLDLVGFISLPQLRNLTVTTASGDATVLIKGSYALTEDSSARPLLAQISTPGVRSIAFTTPVKKASNKHLGDWPWFTYFIYVTARLLKGDAPTEIESYAEWPYSQIPHGDAQVAVILLLCGFGALTIFLFIHFWRKSRREPLRLLPTKSIEVLPEKQATEASAECPPSTPTQKDKDDWSVPGYHKPLSGFFVQFFIAVIVICPVFVLVLYLIPTFILQDPSAFGIQYIVTSIFQAVFIALDFGLAQAYDRFVGQYWNCDQERAIKYVQFFVWFQTLSGLGQTTIISLIGMYWVPQVQSLAFLSWFFVVNPLIQFPGIAYVFTHLLKSAQRTDLEGTVNIISLVVFQLALTGIFTELFRSIGAANPLLGEVVGSSLGISVGSYSGQMALLFFSAFFLRKVDKRFTIAQMFRIDFDRALIKETLLFGVKSMLSNVIFLFGNFISVLIITFSLNNYTYYGAFVAAGTYLTYPILYLTMLYENALPTTSEAYNNGKIKLTEAFVTYGFKYFGAFAIFLFTLFVLPFSVNAIVTSVVPDLYKPIGMILMFYSITKLALSLGDFSKFFLIAVDRAGTYIVCIFIEQVIRVTFLLLTIKELQVWAFVFGEIPGVVIKILLTWVWTHKKILRVRINVWQTFVAPGLACAGVAVVGWILSVLLFEPLQAALGVLGAGILFGCIFFIGFSLFLYPLFLGLLGGWDTETLRHVEFASNHAGPSKLFAKAFFKVTRMACKVSPLHDKFPIQYTEAAQEAQELLAIIKGAQIKKD